jgi:uncharacterized repeat protein (TIGR01451 family)
VGVAAWLAVAVLLVVAGPARAVADGEPFSIVTRQSVFGSSVGVGNTLMEHDGTVNFAVRIEGSQANVSLSDVPADAEVVQAFLFWGGTFDDNAGVPLDATVDLLMPDGTLFNDLAVGSLRPGEAPPSTTNRCVQRDHPVAGDTVQMFSCRREITSLARRLGTGGVVGTWEVSDVDLSPGDCNAAPRQCEAKFGGWALVVLWQSPTEPVKRDLVLADAFFALDEQGSQNRNFSSGLGPDFVIDGLNVGGDESGEITVLAWEGDAQLGVPPQNLASSPIRCTDGRCEDFIDLRSDTRTTRVRLTDPFNRPGNLMNGSNNKSGGSHPGLDLDTFDIGATGLRVLRTGDRSLFVRAGSGDGIADDGSGGSGELFLLGFTLVSVETLSPRFLNAGTQKVVLEPVAGAGETLRYLLRIENDGSAAATNTIIKDQLPDSIAYVAGSTTNTCGITSSDVGGTSPVLTAAGLNVGTIPIGGRCEVRFNVVVKNTVRDGDQIRNFFTVAADGQPALTVGPAVTTVEAAQLSTPTKTVSVQGGGEPAPGSTLVYRIRVDNVGARPAPDVRIVDDMPPELDQIAVVGLPAGATNATSGNRVDVGNLDLAPGSFVEIVVSGRIAPGTPKGTAIVNQGAVEQPSLLQPLLTDDPTVNATSADPTILRTTVGIDLSSSTKTAVDVNGGPLLRGDVVEFRITVDKRGPAETVVSIDDSLPPLVGGCVVVEPLPTNAILTCNPGGTNGTGRVSGFVAFSGAGVVTLAFRVTVDATAPDGTGIANTARIVPLADPDFAVNISSAPLVVIARPDLRVAKAVVDVTTPGNGDVVKIGDTLDYTLTLTNTGTIAAQNVVVTDAVDANLTVVAVQDGGTNAGNLVTFNVASVDVGQTVSLRFSARVNGGVADGTRIDNVATGDADDPQVPVDSNVVSVVVRALPALVVQKTVVDTGPAPFRPGDVVRYTIALSNTGDGAARDVVVTDPLDPAFETALLSGGGRVQGGAVVFDRATVPALASIEPGATATVTFDARLLPSLRNATTVANQASVTTTSLVGATVVSDDPATAAPLDPTTFAVTSTAALALTKTFVDDTPTGGGGALLPGDTVVFTLALQATGDAPAEGVVVEDPLDPRLTFVSSPDGGTLVGGRVRFDAVDVDVGAPQLLRFVARVATPLADGTTIDNQAQATSTTAPATVSDDPNTATPLDPTRLFVTSRPVFDTSEKTVVDVDGDGVFRPRDRVRYTIVVGNTGSEDGVDVVVVDPIPPQLVDVVPGAGGSVVGSDVVFALGTVAVGDRRTLTFEGTIARPLADASVVSNQATVRSPGQPDAVTDDPTTIVPDDPTRFVVRSQPFLTVTKSVVDENGAPVEPGDRLAWTLVATNTGDRTAAGVVVSDVVPANLVDVIVDDGGVLAAGGITWVVGDLAVDATATLRFSSVVTSPLENGTRIDNQASASLSEAGVPGAPFVSDDPTTTTPLDPTRVTVVSAADLSTSSLESFDDGGAVVAVVRPGTVVEYRLVVRNSGRAEGTNVVATVPLPTGVVVLDAGGGRLDGSIVTLAVGTVVPGVDVERRLRVRLPTPLDAGTTFDVQAALEANLLAAPFVSDDPSTAAPSDVTRVVIDSAPLLSLQKTIVDDDADSDGGAFEPGDAVTVTLTLENDGDAVAHDVVVADVLPAGLVHEDGGALVLGTVTFDATSTPSLVAVVPVAAGGAPVVVRFRARVDAGVASGTTIDNQATAASGAPTVTNVVSDDPDTAAVLDPTQIVVTAVPRLTLTKDAQNAGGASVRSVAPGDVVTWVLTATSTGTAPAGGVLTDVLDAAFVDVVPGPDTAFDAASRRLSATIAPLAPGAQATLSFSATVSSSAQNGATIANQARLDDPALGTVVSDDPTTPVVGDPTALVVDGRAVLVAQKTAFDENGGALLPGDRLRYAIRIDNTGNGAARDVQIVDVVDSARLLLVDAPEGSVNGDVVTLTGAQVPELASLARGASVTVELVVQVRADVADGQPIANQATVTSPDAAAATPTDDPTTPAPLDPTVVIVSAPRLVLTKTLREPLPGAPLSPGQALTYDVTLQNQGLVAARDVVLRDPLSPALQSVVVAAGAQTATIVDGVATLPLGDVDAGAAVAITVTAVVDPLAAGGDIVANQAFVTAREVGAPAPSDDPTTPAPADPTTRVVDAAVVLGGTVELFDGENGAPLADGATVADGSRVRARITLQNTGTQAARTVVVAVPLSRLSFVVDNASDGGVIDSVGDDTTVRWTPDALPALATLSPGASVVVELQGRVARPVDDGARIPFAARVSSTTTPEATVLGPVTLVVRSRADLATSTKEVVDENGGLVQPGDVLRWRITVRNDGGAVARDVVVVDPVPAGLRLLPDTTRVNGAPENGDIVQGLSLGDLAVGGAVEVEFSTRVEDAVPRGLVLSNQALLRATGSSDARTDDPRTPLVIGDATTVVVGGGVVLVAQKTASPVPVPPGVPVTFAIAVENAGTEDAVDLVVSDPLPANTTLVPGSVRVDGVAVTEAEDGDGVDVTTGVLRVRRDPLPAGTGMLVQFAVVPDDDARTVVNQAQITAVGQDLLSDGDPAVPGVQPTVVPVQGRAPVLFDENTVQLIDENGDVLQPGDTLLLSVALKNRGVDAQVTALQLALPEQTTVAELDPRLRVVGDTLALAPGAAFVVEQGAVQNITVKLRVDDDTALGTVLSTEASASVRAVVGNDAADVDLGRAAITVGLLPQTAAIDGTLFIDSGDRDGVFVNDDGDVAARGFVVQLQRADDADGDDGANDAPTVSVTTDDQGRFRLAPVPLAPVRLRVSSSSGVRYATVAVDGLTDGEVRVRDVAIEPTGSVWIAGQGGPARGARVSLFVDDGDGDPGNDVKLAPTLLPTGQQDQVVSAQGFYRFDAPPGAWRIGVDSDAALLTFPSSTLPPLSDRQHPLGQQQAGGDVAVVVLPDARSPPPWVARFRVDAGGSALARNHVPLEPLGEQVTLTKTTTKRRASIGDVVTWELRVDNRALESFLVKDGHGVELVDTLPPGFVLVDGSFQLVRLQKDARGQERRDVERVAQAGARSLRFGPFDLQAESGYLLRYNTVVGPGTRRGDNTNRARLVLQGGDAITDEAQARIVVVADELFELSSVRARVFCDDDGDGRADENERGAWGARVYLDNGAWAEADSGGKLHFSGVEPGMHLAKLDERTLLGMSTRQPRQTFYLSAGLPADIAFPVACVDETTGVDAGPDGIVVNAEAWRPAALSNGKTVVVDGKVSGNGPVQVAIDGAPLALPEVAVDVGARAGEPSASGTVELPAPEAGLQLRLRVQGGGGAVLAWQIVIDARGDDGATTPVYVFAGRGAPPARLLWNGRDGEAGPVLLQRGRTYAVRAMVAFAGGDRGTSAPRTVFVRARGAAPSSGAAAVQALVKAAVTVDGEGVDVDGAGAFRRERLVAQRGVLLVQWQAADGSSGRVVVDPWSSSSTAAAALPASSLAPVALRVDPRERALVVDGAASEALALLGVRVASVLDRGAAVVELPRGIEVKKTTVRVLVEKPGAPATSDDDDAIGTVFKDVTVDGGAGRVPLGDMPPADARVRLRAIVVDARGDTGISPDVVLGAPVDDAGGRAPDLVVNDPFGRARSQTLTAAAKSMLASFAARVAPSATVRIEVHSDGRGPRVSRLATSQAQAEAMKRALVQAGVAKERVIAIGRGGEEPVLPNIGPRTRRENRRAELFIDDPSKADVAVRVNGESVAVTADGFDGRVPPLSDGTLAVAVRDAARARAHVTLHPDASVWQGTPEAWRASLATAPATPAPASDVPVTPTTATTATTATTETTTKTTAVEKAPHADGAVPSWWPTVAQVKAATLQVKWPHTADVVQHDLLPLRGQVDPTCRVTVNGVEVVVDAATGTFARQVKLPEGSSSIVVEAVDVAGNRARIKRDVKVDTTGWFFLVLSDAAIGGDGAQLHERQATTSVTMGDVFAYGRAAGWVKGRFHGPVLFSDYDLSLHLDTRRFDNDVFFRDVLDPDRFFPAWGDSSLEVLEARSALPLYIDLTADDSRLTVGNVRTELVAGDLLRYQRARPGAQIVFDRGWLDPVDVTRRAAGQPRAPAAADPWRTRSTTFALGGAGEQHARVELLGTGGSVYFLRHTAVVEGSERVSVIVRDAVTAAEVSRAPLLRNVDYTVRYNEGRVVLKSPLSAYADATFTANHNLGTVTSTNRVFLEVEYEHADATATAGLGGGVDVAQALGGHAEIGSSYVVEGREGGGLAYQVGGARAKLFVDEGTFVKAELLASQSIDAANFFSVDGGLTYSALGASLDDDTAAGPTGGAARDRRGLAFKVDGAARFGTFVGRKADDGVVRAYVQAQEPGFFGGGGTLVEQGQTKWGAETALRLTDVDELRLRYDGVTSAVVASPTSSSPSEARTLQRQLATGRYARRLLPGLQVAAELGWGHTADSGRFGAADTAANAARDFQTLITAAGLEWSPWSPLTLRLKQEVIALGDPLQLASWTDRLVTHAGGRWQLTKDVSVNVDGALRWSGESQVQAGVGLGVNETDRVYVNERFGMLAAPGTSSSSGTLSPSHTTVIGAESQLAPGSKAYGEYQLQSAFGAEQTRGVVGLNGQWALPFGFTLSLGYERITTLAGTVPVTTSGTVPPVAFTDGTFYAAPGQNGSGAFLFGDGSRDAASAGAQWKRGDWFVASQRFELRYDNFAEDRGGHDTLWGLSMTALALKVSPELSMLARYNLALAHDLARQARTASLEEGSFGVAYRPITHDWFSALAKVSRRVDVRPVSLVGGVDDTTVHAASFEPVVNLPWHLQLVDKVAIKHASVAFDDVPRADAVTLLWINRVNLHTFGLLRDVGVAVPLPGEIDVGAEYRVLTGLTYEGVEHGTLVEVQLVPVDQVRVGVGWNFTRFSDNELDGSRAGAVVVDRSGFFVRVVGAW